MISRPIDRLFRHGMQAERGEWYDAQIDTWQTNTSEGKDVRVGFMPPGQRSQTRKTPRLLGYGIMLRRLKHE